MRLHQSRDLSAGHVVRVEELLGDRHHTSRPDHATQLGKCGISISEEFLRAVNTEPTQVAQVSFSGSSIAISGIQEGTALLLEEIPGPLITSQREILEVVRSHSERLFRSLSSVLDLSKMEAGMMEYILPPSSPGCFLPP